MHILRSSRAAEPHFVHDRRSGSASEKHRHEGADRGESDALVGASGGSVEVVDVEADRGGDVRAAGVDDCRHAGDREAFAAPRRIIAIALLVMVACGIFGIPVAKHLSAGGFQDPTSESAQATKLLVDKFGQGDMELLISVTDMSALEASDRSCATTMAA